MDLAICRHIKLGGGRCGLPAMRGQHYCYFHAGSHRSIPSVNLWPNNRPSTSPSAGWRMVDGESWIVNRGWRFALHDPPSTIDDGGDAGAIQLGFTRLIRGLMQGLLNRRQARIILSALHRAAAELRHGTATGDFPVTSNQLRLPIPSGGRALAGCDGATKSPTAATLSTIGMSCERGPLERSLERYA